MNEYDTINSEVVRYNLGPGVSTYRKVSTANNNSALVGSAGARVLYGVFAVNTNAAIRYLKLYDKATAPTVGTDTPVLTIPLAVSGANPIIISLPYGVAFALGLGVGIVTGVADSDNTSTAAGEQIVTLLYK